MISQRIFPILFVIFTCLSCGSNTSDSDALTFWASNNPEELSFIQSYAAKWNTSGRSLTVDVKPIPEGQSSEEIILAAVVGKTTPDIYANMWQGEVEDYAMAGVLVPLDTIDGFLEFIEQRCSREVINEITSSDGHIYQVPWKVNPIMMLYNNGMVQSAGLDTMPLNYSDFIAVGEDLSLDTNGDGYFDIWLGSTEVSPIWWQRLFNFVPLYYAATNGAPIIKNKQAAFDNDEGIKVFEFLQTLYKKGYFPKEQMKGQSDPFLAEKIALKFTGPWTIRQIENYQVTDFEYTFTQMPVPDDHVGPVYTYCDPKNIVVFNTCERPEAAWQFIETLISEEGDLSFLKSSGQLPRRRDLMTNPAFSEHFNTHPEMLPFAEQAKYLRGVESNPNMKEVLDLISQEYEACVVFNKKSPEEAVRDAAQAINLLYLN